MHTKFTEDAFSGVDNFEFQFLGSIKILWILFWVCRESRIFWGSFLSNLGSFLKVKVQDGHRFWGC